MRFASVIVLACSVVFLGSRESRAQTSIGAFGALPINQLSTFSDSTFPVDLGGRISVDLAPGIQAIGEFGRIGNVLPTVVALPVSLTPVNARVSAFYGEGGVRVLAAPRSAVSPYAEATAGMAHLNINIGGLGSTASVAAVAALNLLDRSDPMAGAGGGVIFRGGPVLVDVGYRYKQIFANSLIGTLLSAGQDLRTHQIRFGLGVRF